MTSDTTRHRAIAAVRSRADEENTSVVSILVDQIQDLSRAQRDQGERLASVTTLMTGQSEQLKTIASNVELIRSHTSECPARSGWLALTNTVQDLKTTQEEITKQLAPNPDGPISIIPLKIKGKQLSPIIQILAAIATAIGAGLAGYLAK